MMSHEPHFGFYRYQVQSSLDPSAHWCDTTVRLDSDSGKLVDFWAPTGLEAGDTFTTWIVDLHFGWLGGIIFRTQLFAVGIVGARSVVTGLVNWWRKLKTRSSERDFSKGRSGRALKIALDLVIVGSTNFVLALVL